MKLSLGLRRSGIIFSILILFCPLASHADNSLQYFVKIAPFKAGVPAEYGIEAVHPYLFEVRPLQQAMASLAYQRQDFAWSEKKHVFHREAIEQLAPRLAAAFAQAGPGDRVLFKITDAAGNLVRQGDLFLTPEGLNWRIISIRGSKRQVGDFSIMGDSWRLVPVKGQIYKTREKHKNLVRNITNWIIFPRIRPEAAKRLARPVDSKPVLFSAGDVKKRLRILEELKQEGLVNEEEYRTKRQEIMGRF